MTTKQGASSSPELASPRRNALLCWENASAVQVFAKINLVRF